MNAPMYGKWPGVVESYDPDARTARVSIEGITDGSSTLPEAVFEYPIGDRADAPDSKDHTEIRVLAGDPVWLEFECGDPRFPIITGYRTKRAGNPTGWRRWRHANIEMTADGDMVLNANRLVLNVATDMQTTVGGTSTLNATAHDVTATTSIVGNTSITGGLTTQGGAGGAGVTMQGPVAIEGGEVSHNSKSIGSNHYHTAQGATANTTTPKP